MRCVDAQLVVGSIKENRSIERLTLTNPVRKGGNRDVVLDQYDQIEHIVVPRLFEKRGRDDLLKRIHSSHLFSTAQKKGKDFQRLFGNAERWNEEVVVSFER